MAGYLSASDRAFGHAYTMSEATDLCLRAREIALAHSLRADHSADRALAPELLDLLEVPARERAQRLLADARPEAYPVPRFEHQADLAADVTLGPYALVATLPLSARHAFLLAMQGSPWALFVTWLLRAYPRLDYDELFTPNPRVRGEDCTLALDPRDGTVRVDLEPDAFDLYGSESPADTLRALKAAVVKAEGAPELGWRDADTESRLRLSYAEYAGGRGLDDPLGARWARIAERRATGWELSALRALLQQDADSDDEEARADARLHAAYAPWLLHAADSDDEPWEATLPRSWLHLRFLAERGRHPWAEFLLWLARARGTVFEDVYEAESAMRASQLFTPLQTFVGARFTLRLDWRHGDDRRRKRPRVVLLADERPKRVFRLYKDADALDALKAAFVIKGEAESEEEEEAAKPPPAAAPAAARAPVLRKGLAPRPKSQEAEDPRDLGWGELADEVLRLRELYEANKYHERIAKEPQLAAQLREQAQALTQDAFRGLSGEELVRLRDSPHDLAVRKMYAFEDLRVHPHDKHIFTPVRSVRHLTLIKTTRRQHPWAQFLMKTVLPWVSQTKGTTPFSKAELFSREQLVRTAKGSVRLEWRSFRQPVARVETRALQQDFCIYAASAGERDAELRALVTCFNKCLA